MSDEESFVILGSCSPANSLVSDSSIGNDFQNLRKSQIQADNAENVEGDDEKANHTSAINSIENGKEASEDEQKYSKNGLEISTPTNSLEAKAQEEARQKKSIDQQVSPNNLANGEANGTKYAMDKSTDSNKTQGNSIIAINRSTGSKGSSVNGSLAASFILGEVDADVLKTSIYSQFPSICSMEACAEDVRKLENLMSEYIELKCTLAKVNATMKVFYNKTQEWRDDMQRTEEQYKSQIQNCHKEIAILRNENLELKRELETKIEQIQISEEIKNKEVLQLVASASEKAALIENMRAQISQLEQHQLASFEYVSKHENDTKENPDYIARSEHLLALKELERKMSALLAENLELKDNQNLYLDEINCLKVNLTSAEELFQTARADIALLKEKDLEKSELFAEYERQRDKMNEEISLLRQQVDVYSKDFQMERTARESLAGEKDQLLQDLRILQRSNQQLIEEQHRRLESVVTTSNPSSSGGDSNAAANQALPKSSSPKKEHKYYCPVCEKGYDVLNQLQSHVESCLNNA